MLFYDYDHATWLSIFCLHSEQYSFMNILGLLVVEHMIVAFVLYILQFLQYDFLYAMNTWVNVISNHLGVSNPLGIPSRHHGLIPSHGHPRLDDLRYPKMTWWSCAVEQPLTRRTGSHPWLLGWLKAGFHKFRGLSPTQVEVKKPSVIWIHEIVMG